LQEKLREAIESVLDMDEFEAQIRLQESEAAEIKARRTIVFNALGDRTK